MTETTCAFIGHRPKSVPWKYNEAAPDGVLFGSSKAHKAIRRELVETISFGPKNVWFYDMKADGFSLDDKRTPTTENDIPDMIAQFHNLTGEDARARTEQSFLVPKAEIVENGYDLSVNKYKKAEYVPVEYPPTSEILEELDKLETEITAGLVELRGMV